MLNKYNSSPPIDHRVTEQVQFFVRLVSQHKTDIPGEIACDTDICKLLELAKSVFQCAASSRASGGAFLQSANGYVFTERGVDLLLQQMPTQRSPSRRNSDFKWVCDFAIVAVTVLGHDGEKTDHYRQK